MTTFSKFTAVICSIGVGACAAAAMAAEAPAGAKAAPRRAKMPVEGIVNPDWAQVPSGEVLANYFPPLANFLGLSGRVKMQCAVTTAGTLEACAVEEETPAGLGFGDATLGVAQYFRMRPMTVDGAPVAGGKVVIPMNWRAPEADVPSDPNDDGPRPSPEALALGRRLAVAMGGSARMSSLYRMAIGVVKERSGSAVNTPEGRAALADLDKAVAAGGGGYEQAMAVNYARTFSIAELTSLVSFYESPTGQVWRTRQESLEKAEQSVVQRVSQQMLADTRREFCAKTACLPPPG
jgi:hypothetical protein